MDWERVLMWLAKNALALFGAIVATIAIVPNILGYWHKVWAAKIHLTLLCEPDPKPPNEPDSYVITVINDGDVPAPIAEAGVVDQEGHKHLATKPVQAGNMAHWIAAFDMTLGPHSSEQARVRLKANTPSLRAETAYVIRQDGIEQRVTLSKGTPWLRRVQLVLQRCLGWR